VDALQVAEKLRRILPKDVVVLTQEQIIAHDRDYWISATSTGFTGWGGFLYRWRGDYIRFSTLISLTT